MENSEVKQRYKHVIIIGIDGAGAFNLKTDTPNIDRIFANGAKTDVCLTSIPTISAQCWGSMLTGVSPEKHALTNSIVDREEYKNADYPTLFKLVRTEHSDAVLAAFCNWKPILTGIIEGGLDVEMMTGDDAAITERSVDFIASQKPELLFIHFDEVDGAGHSSDYGSREHLAAITRADSFVGEIYDSVVKAGMKDDTLFIVTSDHGGKDFSHGGTSDEEKYVMFYVCGRGVLHSDIRNMKFSDVPAIVARALGVSAGDNWEAAVPEGIFADN